MNKQQIYCSRIDVNFITKVSSEAFVTSLKKSHVCGKIVNTLYFEIPKST